MNMDLIFKKLIKFGNIVFCKNYDIGLDLWSSFRVKLKFVYCFFYDIL